MLELLETLCPEAVITGMDYLPETLLLARSRTRCTILKGNIAKIEVDCQFHLICLFDVLEHLPDDKDVLRKLYSMLLPNGALLLTVPAFPSLWSYFDEVSHHYRRYRFGELIEKLQSEGYVVEFLSHFMASLLPIVWLHRKWVKLWSPRLSDDSDRLREIFKRELRIIPIFNEVFRWLLGKEASWVGNRRRLPFGTSLVAIARKA